jgi:hypothetical protein
MSEQEKSSKKITCWTCCGSGLGAVTASGSGIFCDRCDGTGECPAEMRQWQDAGRKLKQARLDKGLTLPDWAKVNGFDPDMASKAERGIIDPQTLRKKRDVDLEQLERDIHGMCREFEIAHEQDIETILWGFSRVRIRCRAERQLKEICEAAVKNAEL